MSDDANRPLELADDEVHVWLTFPEEIRAPSLLARYHALLNPEEAAQQKRYHFERHRHQYLLTRALCRTLLSRYDPSHGPAEWRFEKNEYGRPHIAPEQNSANLRFNLSHTDGLIACAVVRGREVGVDCEDIKRGGDLISIADRYFSPSEVADLHTVPPARQEFRFFDYWTLKESYIKARGMGLSIPLDQFSFHIDEDAKDIGLTVDPRQNDPAERWQFRQWHFGDRFKVSLCLERRPGVSFKTALRQCAPFAVDEPFPCDDLRNGFDKGV